MDLSSALGGGEPGEIRRTVEEAAGRSDSRAVEEALLQAYLFVGFPPVLGAVESWRSRRASPVDEPSEEVTADREDWRRRGEALCRRVYGSAYAKLRGKVRRLHPALDRWMVEEGYGKVLSRPGLDPLSRELCIVALLAAAGHERQLHSHLRGALELGGRPADIEEALEAGLARSTHPGRSQDLRNLWAGVRGRAGTEG